MSNEYERWLDAYESACVGPGAVNVIACPHCGTTSLNLLFLSFQRSNQSVMPAFWCNTCLRGLPPVRALLPGWASPTGWGEVALPDYDMVAEEPS